MSDLTRREGGVVVGLVLGGAAASETAVADHGKTGGAMLLLSDSIRGVPFTAEPTEFGEFEFPASCFASKSALKGFRELLVTYSNGVQVLAAIRTNKKHFAADGATTYVFTSSQQCRDSASPTGADIWKASFRPA